MKVTMEFTEGGIKHDASLRKLLDEVGEHLSRARRCVVVTGAGISVSGGIPVGISRAIR